MFLLDTAYKDLKRKLRDPMAFLVWLGIPIVIGGMIQLAFGGSGGGSGPKATVLVADQDASLLSGLLLGAMGQQQGQKLPFEAEEVTLEDGRDRIDDGDASALLIIPDGFGHALLHEETCTLELVTNPAQRILPGMVEETLTLLIDAVFYAHRVFGEPIQAMLQDPPAGANTLANEEVARISVMINDVVERTVELLDPPAIDLVIEVEEEEEKDLDMGAIFFPSMLFMTLFFLAQGMSEDLWVEKQGGTLRRALTTPNRASAFLGGKLATAVLIISLVSFFGILLGRLVFGLDLKNLLLATAWSGVAGAFLTLLMMILQLIASSQRAANLLANLVMMPMLMLGGSFFPFEAMPGGLASIGRKTPNGWALEQLKAITNDVYTAADLGMAFLGLTAVSAVLFLITTKRLAGAFARS